MKPFANVVRMPSALSVIFLPLLILAASVHAEENQKADPLQPDAIEASVEPVSQATTPDAQENTATATNMRLDEVFESPATEAVLPQVQPLEEVIDPSMIEAAPQDWNSVDFLLTPDEILRHPNSTRTLLGTDIPPATSTRLIWEPSRTFAGMAVDTPVLVVNGASDGPTLCLTAAIHGDELNGIEMIRRIMFNLDPEKLHGMVVGVPIVNLMGFSRSSRYLPDRRDLNRYFPGNPTGSVAARIAYAFFNDIVTNCDLLVDIHTGSFYRTNMPQLRADMGNSRVAAFVELFGDIPVLNSSGNQRTLRAAAVRAGIPSVTLEAGEPMRMQRDMVNVGVKTINTLMAKSGMYSKLGLWVKPKPAFYDSFWVRVNSSGILFSEIELGDNVEEGDILGAVSNPVSNEKIEIVSPYSGRVLGMALDQFVMPGFAVYHIGIRAEKGEQRPIENEEETVAESSRLEDSAEEIEADESEGPLGMLMEEEVFED
ncbi:MAG: succinylglutamate desuccinylase/aspartoacylase family protein [Pseudomonadota bacterium]